MEYSSREIVELGQAKIFAIIADVDHYHQFLPWCQASRVIENQGEGRLLAELLIGFQHLREKFTSQVLIAPERGRVEMGLPAHLTQTVKKLDSYWQLTALGQDKTEIEFYINFEMRSFIHNQIMKTVMKQTVKNMSAAFIKRAYELS